MNRKSFILGLAGVLAAGWALSAQATEFARWNSVTSNPMAGTYAPIANHPNLIVSNLVAGDNLNRTGSGAATETFAAAAH